MCLPRDGRKSEAVGSPFPLCPHLVIYAVWVFSNPGFSQDPRTTNMDKETKRVAVKPRTNYTGEAGCSWAAN